MTFEYRNKKIDAIVDDFLSQDISIYTPENFDDALQKMNFIWDAKGIGKQDTDRDNAYDNKVIAIAQHYNALWYDLLRFTGLPIHANAKINIILPMLCERNLAQSLKNAAEVIALQEKL